MKETVTLGAGCFWCVDAIFSSLKGVEQVVSGYSGGALKNPTYKDICTGTTGHAEVCQITFDSAIISFANLLEVFWQTHDPTTLNKQGGDIGTQYRSAIFYHTDNQKKIALAYLKKMTDKAVFKNPIITEVIPSSLFYSAEAYHQDYFELNGEQPYCTAVVKPKLYKFKEVFKDKLK